MRNTKAKETKTKVGRKVLRIINKFVEKKKKTLLRFQLGNGKLSKAIATFSLPAGWSCPFAKECLSKANRLTGKIIDGKHCEYRCFAASTECVFPSVRHSRWFNYDLLLTCKSVQEMANLIQDSLPWGINMVRIHVSGDFYKESYFLAWLNVALNNPLVVFYAYTKALPWMIKYKKHLPNNFRLTASKGGTCDNLIVKNKLKYAEVVFSTEEARRKGLEIDHDDSHAYNSNQSFALLLHGTQPANTKAGTALKQLRKEGIGGYGPNNTWRQSMRQTKSVQIKVGSVNGKVFVKGY